MRDRFECIDVLKGIWKIDVYLFNDIKIFSIKLNKVGRKETLLFVTLFK